MRFQRLLLSIIFMLIIFLAVSCLDSSDEGSYPVPFASTYQKIASDSFLLESSLRTAPPDPKRLEEISKVLTMIPQGLSTLSLIDKYEIGVVFEFGTGSYFSPKSNQIIIDAQYGKFSAALILVHEVTHAQYFHEGLAAEISAGNRQAYVLRRLKEEMVAVVNQVDARTDLAEVGIDTSDLMSPLYYTYRSAYLSTIRVAGNDNPELTDKILQDFGGAAGRTAVLEALLTGEAVTSNTQESYKDYWGAKWDSEHDSA